MEGLRVIQTTYKGYRFRSRLEARWAVFFDALGMQWEYEKEGFDINGRWYLPDFYLQDIQSFAEVKPTVFSQEEFTLARACGCVHLEGMPDVKWYYHGGCRHPHDSVTCSSICYDVYRAGAWSGIHFPSSLHKKRPWYRAGEDIRIYDNRDFLRAVYAARAARFEHGEQG